MPTPLGRIAKTRKVSSVVFRPLLVLGCLETVDYGFKISVNCEVARESDYQAWFTNASTEHRLPGRVRFTIAHEIAHTFLFDPSTTPPTDLTDTEDPGELDEIERICDQIAAELLLPKAIIRRIATEQSCDFMDPDSLRKLARPSPKRGIHGCL